MDGRKERREEEGSDRTGVVEGGRRKGRRRGEKGNWENRAGRKAQAPRVQEVRTGCKAL